MECESSKVVSLQETLKLNPSTSIESESTLNDQTQSVSKHEEQKDKGKDFGGQCDSTKANPSSFTPNSGIISSLQTSCSPTNTIQGHSFIRRTLHKPAYCHHCGEVIWGLLGSGFQCEICNLLAHERCQTVVSSPCTSVAPLHIKSPVSHCWSDVGHFKRKFCNVCRKRLEDSLSVRCEVCEYYCHVDCQDYSINDCKQGATCSPGKPVCSPRQTHHWREGNLPTNSKCFICRKTCWSSECLTGYRCQWCGRTSHAGCIEKVDDECDFGPLRDIMLPSFCVSLPRMNIPIEHVIGVTKRPRGRAISADWSSSGESKEDSWQDTRSPRETIDRASSDEYLCVFDGVGALKRRSCRSFSFSKSMSTYSAVKRFLKTFHLAGTPDYYNVYEVNEHDGTENKLNYHVNLRSQLRFDLKQPSILIRSKEPEESTITIKVYAGDLRLLLAPHVPPYEEVTINSETTASKVVAMALNNFGCGHMSPDDCYLSSVCVDRTVSEQLLNKDDRPMLLLDQLREESARISQFTRFELRFVEDPPIGPSVSLFVGNLKENLSQRLYERVLLDKLGEKCRWDSIEVIYYESGCLVLNYHSSEKAEQAYELLNESIFMNKPITALLLPTIHPQNLPKGIQPLLVFVNLKSGGCQGVDLIVAFRRLLNPFQVFNLDYGGPLPGLYCFRHLASYKILVCGGDGTVGWTLSCLDIVGQDAACNAPPIAPLPLGTGNDLSRVLRWGSGYSSADDPLTILKDVVAAEEVKLDRWTLIVRPEEDFKDETKLALELQTNASNTNEDNSIMIIMNNYFGIGIDADLSLDFHNARSENPSKFNSRIHNKGVYFKIGLRKMINRTICKDLHKQIVVIADGKIVILPPIEGLVVLNILSWGGGANPWNVEKHDDEFVKPTHYDGLLEIVGISGVVHMGQIYSGLGTGIRLAQAAHLKIWLKSELPIQVDGEPFIHPPGQITVLRSALSANMLRKVKRPKRRPGTEDYGLNQLSSTTDQQYQNSIQQYSTTRLHDFSSSSDYSSLNVIQNIKEDLQLPINKLNMDPFISDTPTYSKPIINLTSKPIYNKVNTPTNTVQSSTVSAVHSNDNDNTAVYHQGSLTNTLNQLSLGSNIRSQEVLSSSSSVNLPSSLLRICSYTTLSGDDSV
ncbi:hypothetical protein MS3_00001785 [Schistosoma haematobium]|uniref:Diacylglycerol kinase n=2 Tax=Schistosoma haematobium TaxID=6185 RepID=A0A922LXT7_SCHHA|nr:hypothetical protein MS3_00001785 [Schistosoma haematobium]KAH9595917.1 hypothetical protein MS3_00001785 [Schistosoma haematobium]CAH8476706.1 unnamed protein product [Schistosoma haematobium]